MAMELLATSLTGGCLWLTHGTKNGPLAHRTCLICLPSVVLLKVDVGARTSGGFKYLFQHGWNFIRDQIFLNIVRQTMQIESQKAKRFQSLWWSLDRKSTVKSATV